MKIAKSLLWMFAGAVLCVSGEHFWKLQTVHAQTPLGSEAACITRIPKAWGTFKGASEYGLAFEDENGTLRFLKSPSCSENFYMNPVGKPIFDLMMERK